MPENMNQQESGSVRTQEPKTGKKSLFSNVSRAGRKPKLNKFFETHEDVYQKILMFIEQGVYDYIAAESMGITNQTWNKWLNIGERHYYEGKRSYYAKFFIDVRTAQSRGRLLAELEVRRDDPKFFLRCGPGKTRPGRPGWTENIMIGSDEDMPLEIEVSGTEQTSSSIQDLAATLVAMEQLGFIQTSSIGKSVISSTQTPHTIQAKLEQSQDEDLSDILGGSDESTSHDGYAPELEAKYKINPEGNGNGKS